MKVAPFVVGGVTGMLAGHFGGYEALAWVFVGFVNAVIVFWDELTRRRGVMP